MKSDFDQHFGLAYGLVSVTATGGHDVVDSNSRLADQAGIAEALLQAFDASREQQYLSYARSTLHPLMDETAAIRGDSGYVSGFDLRGAGPSVAGRSMTHTAPAGQRAQRDPAERPPARRVPPPGAPRQTR